MIRKEGEERDVPIRKIITQKYIVLEDMAKHSAQSAHAVEYGANAAQGLVLVEDNAVDRTG